MKTIAIIAFIGLASAACATQADDLRTRDEKAFLKAAEHGGAEAELDGEKVLCKREAVTGSRMAKSVCMTRAQWEERERQAEALLGNTVDRAGTTSDPRGGNATE